ncbi:MAG: ATP-dependent DNA helicase [Sarcina sp.]
MNSYIDNIVYLLISTTGQSLYDDFIFKIDAIKFANGKESSLTSFIKVPSNHFIFTNNFLKEENLVNIKKAPTFKDFSKELLTFISDFPIITFNNKEQISFFRKELSNNKITLNNEFLDAFELFLLIEPWHLDFSLPYLLEEKLSLVKKLEDITTKNFISLTNKILEENNIGDFISHYGLYLDQWNWHNYLINFNISEELFKEKQEVFNENIFSEDSKTIALKEDCEELLKDPEGFLSLNGNFKFRKAQYDVMKTVRSTLDKNLVSIIEAPTGTGKSIAYLLPAISKAYHKGQKIFISTNTKELQRQLVYKDIPFLLQSFNLKNKVDVVNIKGKSNYLCIDIIQSLLDDSSFDSTKTLKESMALVYLHRYCYKGKAGDREEINFEAEKALNLSELIKFSLCDSDGCNIKSCPYQCYYKDIVEKLKTSTIVVLNHSLLLKWPYDSNIENVIIDEAHNLSDSIFDAYAAALNSKELKSLLLEILDYKNKKGYLNYVWKYTPNRTTNFREIVRDKIDLCFLAMDRLSYLTSKEKENNYDLDVTFTKEKFLNHGKIVHELLVLKEELIDFYKTLSDFIEKNNLDNNKVKNRGEVLIKKVERVKELIDFIDLFTTVEPDKNKCYGFFIEKQNRFWECYIKDLNSSMIFFERFLNNLNSCNFLSATLKNNSSYEGFKKSLALDKADDRFLKELTDVENSFDLKNRTIIFSPTDSPKYFDSNFINYMVNSVIKILDSYKGNLLILFTSKKRLLEFKEKITPYSLSKKINLFDKKQDIKKLSISSNQSILLGSKGFFEGLDIPGDLLNMVLIDKMPNINPYNPLFEKFISNGFTFHSLNVPRATISFKQCFGRLIRTEFDYGYFIIFDKCNQHNIISNISKEYGFLRVVDSPFKSLIADLNPRIKYWNSLNFNLLIKTTLVDLEDFLRTYAKGLFGNPKELEKALNDFYLEKHKEFKLKKNIFISIKDKKLKIFYIDNSELQISNKKLILETLNKVFS